MLVAIPAASFAVMMPKAASPVGRVDPASYAVQTIATGLDRPWSVTILPDGRRLVTETGGRLRGFAPDGRPFVVATDGLRAMLHRTEPR